MPRITTSPPVRKRGDGQRYTYSYRYYGYHNYQQEKRPRELNKRLLVGTLLFLAVTAPALFFWHDYQIKRLATSLVVHGDAMAAKQQWKAASDAYYRAWEIRQDPKIIGMLAPAYDKYAVGFDRDGVIASYQRALGALPERVDLRVRLAELLLRQKQYAQSLEQTQKTLALDGENRQAKKWLALATFGIHESDGSVSSEQIRSLLQDAFDRLPGDLELATEFSRCLREAIPTQHESTLAPLADTVMDRFVAAASGDPRAFVARYRYRSRYNLPGAKRDLDRAVALAPENPMIVHEAARDALRDAIRTQQAGDYMVARELFKRLIELRPKDTAGYLGLGDALYSSGVRRERRQAIDRWQEGREQAGESLPLIIRIAEAQIQLEQYGAAETTLAETDKLLATLSGRGSGRDRAWATGSVAYLRGLMHLGKGDLHAAVPHLTMASALDPTDLDQSSRGPTAFPALIKLGQVQANIGQVEEAAVTFDRALRIEPDSAVALLQGASAWARLGDYQRAIRYTETAIRQSDVDKDAHRLLAEFHLQRQLALPKAERRWGEFLIPLKAARAQLANSWELSLLEVDYQLRANGEDRSQAVGKLLLLEQDYPSEVEVWKRLPFIYEVLGMRDDTDRAIERLEELTAASSSGKVLLADILLGRGDLSAARRVLAGVAVDQLTLQEKWDHDLAGLRLVEASGDAGEIDRTLVDLANGYQTKAFALERLLDRRLRGASLGTEPSTESLLSMLRQRETASEAKWQYYVARIELESAQPNLDKVNELVGLLRNRLPYWSRTQELSGRLLNHLGDVKGATFAFRDAVAKPNPNPELFKLIIEQNLLVGDHLANIQLIEQRQQIEPLSELLEDGHWSQLQFQLDLSAVDDGLAAETPGDLVWSVFVGVRENLLDTYLNENPEDAAGLMLSLDRAARNADVALQKTLLQKLSEREYDSSSVRSFVLGQALQIADDLPAAQEAYGRVDDKSEFRLRAELYAGIVERKRESQRRVPVSPTLTAALAQKRLEAIMRLRRSGRDDLRVAKYLLAEIVAGAHAQPNDRVLLAKCLEKLGDPDAAGVELLTVAESAPTAQHLVTLIDFLLRRGENDQAHVWLEQLEVQSDSTKAAVALRARWLAATNRENEINRLVEEFARGHLASPANAELPRRIRDVAEIYHGANLNSDAKRWLGILADRFPTQSAPLSFLMVESDDTDQAVQRCIQQLEESPNTETATLLARILVYGTVRDEMLNQVMPLLEEALHQDLDNASLVFAVGNVCLKWGDTERAIELLSRVTKVRPGHYLAWNNLAALLAEQEGRETEAMETIEQAIAHAAYEIPTLLDTKAVVLMHQGQHREAAELLREVTESRSASDPRFFFHLAVSLEQLDDASAAKLALAEADNLGIERAFLTDHELGLLAGLRERLTEKN